ncbi:hypothetical protein [Pseudonocardia sp. GCM10023141]|uniref:hypothetical protein n=1 Tax=Pseudonocardia sp. GCM10023141 TaxID=3252653 RepID=UPI00361C1AFA
MAGISPPVSATAMVLSRRRLLAGLLLTPPVLAGCSLGRSSAPPAPDPLIALASAARSDAALAAAVIAAKATLADRVEPLRAARVEHAAALDAEVSRVTPTRTPAPAPPTAPTAGEVAGQPVTLAQLHDALEASAKAAATAAMDAPAARVGLVASVAACCSTYAKVLV